MALTLTLSRAAVVLMGLLLNEMQPPSSRAVKPVPCSRCSWRPGSIPTRRSESRSSPTTRAFV
jgi:hypothetical protein